MRTEIFLRSLGMWLNNKLMKIAAIVAAAIASADTAFGYPLFYSINCGSIYILVYTMCVLCIVYLYI